MEEEGYITKQERESAYNQSLYLSSLKKGIEANSYFVEYIRKYLEENTEKRRCTKQVSRHIPR